MSDPVYMNTFIYTLLVLALPLAALADGPDYQTPGEIEAARQIIERDFANAVQPQHLSASDKVGILNKYQHLDPKHWVPTDLLEKTLIYFDANKERFPNQSYLTVIDFKPRSNRYRFFLIDLTTGEVERYRTTHGIGSDRNNDGYAERFGNENGSGKTSLGFVRTAEVYHGKYKRSLRLDGLDSTNSAIRRRAIVYHGWDGVKEADVIQKRSWAFLGGGSFARITFSEGRHGRNGVRPSQLNR